VDEFQIVIPVESEKDVQKREREREREREKVRGRKMAMAGPESSFASLSPLRYSISRNTKTACHSCCIDLQDFF
jgi:hypothetical protein